MLDASVSVFGRLSVNHHDTNERKEKRREGKGREGKGREGKGRPTLCLFGGRVLEVEKLLLEGRGLEELVLVEELAERSVELLVVPTEGKRGWGGDV